MEELTDLQKRGLERLGRKETKKAYSHDKYQRNAYVSGRVDGILIGLSIISIPMTVALILTEVFYG